MILVDFGPRKYQSLQSQILNTGIHWDALGYTGIHWDTLGYTGIHWDTLGYTGIHWVLYEKATLTNIDIMFSGEINVLIITTPWF